MDSSDANSELESTEGKARETSKSIGERMQEGLGKAEKAIGTVGKGMSTWVTGPIVGAAAGIFGLMTKTGDYADRVLDLRDITGLSTDSIQEWAYVADIAGVSGEAVTTAVTGLIKRLPQLEAEGGKATEGMEKLGISYDELNKLSPDEQVDLLMNSLAEIEDPIERNVIGSQLFGGAWQDLAPILGMGADEIANTRDEAHELNTVMSEEGLQDANAFRQEMERLKNEFGGAFREISNNFLPIFRDQLLPVLRDHVIPAVGRFADKISDVITWFTSLDGSAQQNILKWIGILAAIGPVLLIVAKVIGVLKLLVGAFLFLVSPVGTVIAIIALLIGIGVMLWKNWDTVVEKSTQMHLAVQAAVQKMVQAVVDFFVDLDRRLREIVQKMKQAVIDAFWEFDAKARETVQKMVQSVVNFFVELDRKLRETVQKMKDAVIKSFWDFDTKVRKSVQGMKDAVIKAFWDFDTKVRKTVQGMKDAVVGFFVELWQKSVSKVKELVSGVISNAQKMKNDFVSKVTEIKNGVLSKFNEIKTGIVSKIQETVSNVKSKFGEVYDNIMKPVNRARDAVKTAIDKIKGFFNFKWKLPKIKMPKFSVSGSANPINWIKEGVPKLKVDWFAQGGILEKATAFGMNGNSVQVGGEAGREAVLPLNASNLAGIGAGIAQASGFDLHDIKQMLQGILNEIRSVGDRPVIVNVELDGRVIARVTRDPMDKELENKANLKKRGR